MADVVLDLTKKAVEGTVSSVLAAIDEDTKLKSAVKQDLRFIVGEFQMMESFLEMANDNKERTRSKVVKTWVRQLRELAFDVEDSVEFVIHLDTTSARVWWSWVWRVMPLPSCMTPAWVRDLHQAYAQLKQIKARVEEVSQRNTRYNLFGADDSGSSTTPSPVPPEQLQAAAFPSTLDILRDLWKANAKQNSSLKCNLKYLLSDGRCKQLRVISVCRAAGLDLEAAHILNTTYRDPEICGQFRARAMVKLIHPFNIQEFLKTLLNQLYVTSLQLDTRRADLLRTNVDIDIQDQLRQLVTQHKYLVILEGLSSVVEWDLIKSYLPDLDKGSRIVISTEQLGFAISCTGEPHRVLQLALFPNDRYIYAFYKPYIGVTELVTQLGQRRVISLWGDEGGDTTDLVREVFEAIQNKTAKFKGVNFKACEWNKVPSTSSEDFYQCLPGYVIAGFKNPHSYFANWRTSCMNRFLAVIEGLQSTESWDSIKDELVPKYTKSCIVIISNKEAVANYCKDDYPRKIDDDEQEEATNAAITGPLFAQESSVARKTQLVRQLGQRRVISLWKYKSGDISSVVRNVYEAIKGKTAKFKGVNFEVCEWVNVPSPFSLDWFCRCLPQYADAGYPDPESYFAGFWRKKVCESRCLFVIEGLQSTEDWDSIRNALMPVYTKSCIVIIANQEMVAAHCENNSWRNMDDDAIIGPLSAQKDQYYSWGHDDHFGNHGCSRRMKEAFCQFEQFITLEQYVMLGLMLQFNISYYAVNAVWGGTGVGKSALVRFLYYYLMAYSLKRIEYGDLPQMLYTSEDDKYLTMFDRFGWVDVPEPFDLAEFSRRLLLDFNSYDPGKMEKTAVGLIQGHDPIQRCHETIRKHKCLVVIDGLRSTRDWDTIKQAFFCHHDLQSCIVVVTIYENVAKHCVTKDQTIITIKALGDNKSALDLYKKAAYKRQERWGHEWTMEQKLKHANRIVPKCGGHPKIIDAVAKSDRSFWQSINDDDNLVTNLQNDPQLFGHLRGVLSWMHSYFDDRSDSVKPCIFYLSVFPTNYKIRKAHLLRRWIAEGYSRDTTDCSAKENAEELFKELVKAGIIQEVPGMPLCQINGFFREYIISQRMEDNLVFALEGHCKPNLQRTGQHLTIMKSWEREQKNVFESIDVSRLRSLTVYGVWKSFFISENKMRRIRVLDLEGTSGLDDDELERIFGILLGLKFISLRGCKTIKCLPKALGGLRQLESLDVRGTSIVTLPQAITKLQKMQYIRAGRKLLPFEDWTSAASEEDSDNADGSQPSGTTTIPVEGTSEGPPQAPISGTTPTPTPVEGTSEGPPEAPRSSQNKEEDGARQKKLVGRCWTSTKSSRLSPPLPCKLCSGFDDKDHINGGVEVPVGIEDMPALHTLGTVNIKSARGKDFLTKLKDRTKLPQLLKLSVCGINKENWEDLCDALSAHDYLESLSLGLQEDFTEDMCFDNLPKALKSLRLYGHIHRLPAWTWIKDPRLLVNKKFDKFDLEVIISRQQGLDESLPHTHTGIPFLRRLCIKATQQVTELEFKPVVGLYDYNNSGYSLFRIEPQVLKIDCSSELKVTFQQQSIAAKVKVLIIHCSKGSDFRISSNEMGLNNLYELDTVWLKGYDDKADSAAAHLKKHIRRLGRKHLVFKFEKLMAA